MDTLMKELINRIVAKYDSLIAELEAVNEENKIFLDNVTESKDVPLAIMEQRMKIAKENLDRLKLAKGEKDSLIQNYLQN